MNEDEEAMFDILKSQEQVQEIDPTVTGFNVSCNDGTDAGQSIFHLHFHLIPRRQGILKTHKEVFVGLYRRNKICQEKIKYCSKKCKKSMYKKMQV